MKGISENSFIFSTIRCRKCQGLKKGVVLPSYNLKLCLSCFVEFFKARVKETIEKFKMFTEKEKIAVAVSGGKDSIALAKVLKELGYQIFLIHINCQIKENNYSLNSQKTVEEFARKENLPLKVVDLKNEIEVDLKKCAKISRKEICAVCGMIRRYLLNREAKKFDVLSTGHTLNDEASSLLSSLIFWKDGFLARQFPVLKERESLGRRVKPLCLSFERETEVFCQILNLPYLSQRCPWRGGTYVFFKRIINEIESEMPSSTLNFYKGFLKRKRRFFSSFPKETLTPCERCGYLTSAKICSFCRLKEKIEIFLKKGEK